MAVSARDPRESLPDVVEGRGRHARGQAPRPNRGGSGRWLRETGIIIVSALVLSALVRAFLVQAFYVPSASMEDTLLIGDRIIASKITQTVSGVSRGEVVVFKDPGGWLDAQKVVPATGLRGALHTALTFIGLMPSDSGSDLVKRGIAVGGDRIACCDVDGRIVLNGVPLIEDYIKGPTDQVQFDVVVPPNSVFVMGDNRGDSRDSRYHLDVNNGGVPVSNAVGRVVVVIWPLNRLAVVPIPGIFGEPAISDGPLGVTPSTPAQMTDAGDLGADSLPPIDDTPIDVPTIDVPGIDDTPVDEGSTG
ncbi:MAG: signal peptidase I [Candidatus Nanopelagicales bacterium]